jgi:drug/metabolite transporter (DMT)-like permease
MLSFSAVDGVWKYCLTVTTIPVVFCLTFTISCIALTAYAGVTKTSLRPESKARVLIYTGFYVLELGTFIYALAHVPLVELFVVILTTPLFVLICAHFFLHEKLALSQILAIFSGFSGTLIVVIARLSIESSHPVETQMLASGIPAIAFAIANVIFGGTKILFLRKFCRDENVFSISVFTCFVFALGAACVAGEALLDTPLVVLGLLSCAGILSAAGQIAYVRATQVSRAPLMSATQYSQIIWAALMGVLIFDEALTLPAVGGAALIIASGILLYGRCIPRCIPRRKAA